LPVQVVRLEALAALKRGVQDARGRLVLAILEETIRKKRGEPP
jgi:hypothetical protein